MIMNVTRWRSQKGRSYLKDYKHTSLETYI